VQPSPSGHQQLPRVVGGVLASESRALLSEWLLLGNSPPQAALERHFAAAG
jgi:hypothetical protein